MAELVLRLVSFCLLPVLTVCLRNYAFPVFPLTGTENFCHNTTEAGKHFFTVNLTLDEMLNTCREEGFQFMEICNCEYYFCANDLDANFLVLDSVPDYRYNLCEDTVDLFGSFEIRQSDTNVNYVSTIYSTALSDSQIDSPLPEGFEYCACVSKEIFDEFNLGTNGDETDQLFADISNGGLQFIYANDSLKYRIWDLGYECTYWYPTYDFHGPTKKAENENGYPLYSKKNCNDFVIPNVVGDKNIDQIHFQNKPFCIKERWLFSGTIERPPIITDFNNTHLCIEACAGFNVAMISPDACYCANFNELPNILVLDASSSCDVCQDNENFTCGAKLDFPRETFFSVYILDDAKQESEFVQCVKIDLLNEIKTTLDENLFLQTEVERPIDCLDLCTENDFELAFLSQTATSTVECICTSNYKITEKDVFSMPETCVESWCPGIQGPCFSNPTKPQRAVYCVKEGSPACRELASNEILYNVCSLNEIIPIEASGYIAEYFKCQLNEFTGRHVWSLVKCSENLDETVCSSDSWIDDVVDQITENPTIPALNISNDILDNLAVDILTPGGIEEIVFAFELLLDLRRNQSLNEFFDHDPQMNENFTQSIFSNFDIVFRQKSWQEIEPAVGFEVTTKLIEAIKRAGFMHLDVDVRRNKTSPTLSIDKEAFYSEMVVVDEIPKDKIYFGKSRETQIVVSDLQDALGTDLELVDDYIFDEKLAYVGTVFNLVNITNRFPNYFEDETGNMKFRNLDSDKIIDFSLPFKSVYVPVDIEIRHDKFDGDIACVFWETSQQEWSSANCYLNEKKSSSRLTVCSCYHLTTFTAIFGESDVKPYMNLLSQILAGISSGMLLATVVFITLWRSSKRLRLNVEINRNLCLMLSLLLFMYIVDTDMVKSTPLACVAVTFVTHYFWLATFLWTASEGYMLYRALVVVFDTGDVKIYPFYIICYGIPAVLATATYIPAIVLANENDVSLYSELNCHGYCNEDICWLNTNYIWGFTGPLVFVLIYNFYILILGLRVAYKATERRNLSSWNKLKSWVRNCVILTLLLGITWVFGFFIYIRAANPVVSEVLQVIFIVSNASTGIFIFFYTVVFSRTFKDASKRLLTRTATFATKSTRATVRSDKDGRQRKWTKSTLINDSVAGLPEKHHDGSSSGYGSDNYIHGDLTNRGRNDEMVRGLSSKRPNGVPESGPQTRAAFKRNQRRGM